ncbi:E3 ubiquitin-protein ligase RNF4-like [Ochlerotatus camptorhynchus]|uniref:E3 ubiquitin-protein ligase RNF4-like n=1 Tax=Ochlerotatus camptorhynchus TaxID=644619 RepID=UPI0031DE3B71
MDSDSEDLEEDSSNESMLDVIERANAFLGAAYSSSEWSFRSSAGEPSTSYGSRSTSGGLSRLDSDCVILEAFSNASSTVDVRCFPPNDVSLQLGSRRRRADGIPVVESVSLDDTVNDLEVNLAPSPPRKPTDNSPVAPPPPVPVSCPICFDSVFEQQAASTVCGHMFCHSCITKEVEIRHKCPMCQRPLNSSQVIPIYVN